MRLGGGVGGVARGGGGAGTEYLIWTCGPVALIGLVQPECELMHAHLDGAVLINSEGGNLSLSSGGRLSLI